MSIITITTACGSLDEAEKLASGLREQKLAASVHLQKILSFYNWENKEYISKEIEVSAITLRSLYDDVETYIQANHAYKCPQIISTRIDNVSQDFCNWVESNVKVPTGLKFDDV